MECDHAATYLQEADDLLADIEQCALALDEGQPAAELVNQLFRAFHTIKGSGAMWRVRPRGEVHASCRDPVGSSSERCSPASPSLVELVLASKDQIRLLLAVEQGYRNGGRGSLSEVDHIDTGSCRRFYKHSSLKGRPVPDRGAGQDRNPQDDTRAQLDYSIPATSSFSRNGGNPVVLFRDLHKLGHCEICADTEAIPALEELRADQCYLRWTITLRSSAVRDEIQDIFIFAEDEGQLEIECSDLLADTVPAGYGA